LRLVVAPALSNRVCQPGVAADGARNDDKKVAAEGKASKVYPPMAYPVFAIRLSPNSETKFKNREILQLYDLLYARRTKRAFALCQFGGLNEAKTFDLLYGGGKKKICM
jgi:hypothetical protein